MGKKNNELLEETFDKAYRFLSGVGVACPGCRDCKRVKESPGDKLWQGLDPTMRTNIIAMLADALNGPSIKESVVIKPFLSYLRVVKIALDDEEKKILAFLAELEIHAPIVEAILDLLVVHHLGKFEGKNRPRQLIPANLKHYFKQHLRLFRKQMPLTRMASR